jgi:putative molybdopterin biosynthesis protein
MKIKVLRIKDNVIYTLHMPSRLREYREQSKYSATALAAAAGVTRQTVHAIEAGSFVPNTAIALKLARLLGATVEQLFADPEQARTEDPEWLTPAAQMQPAQLARVGARLMALPSTPFSWPEADAISGVTMPSDYELGRRVVVAGCDPAIAIVARHLAANTPFRVVAFNCSSTRSSQLLQEGKVHIAGTHLAGGVPAKTRSFTLAFWEEGIVTQPGNPKKLATVADLARPDILIVNREKGAGSRTFLDAELRRAGIKSSAVAGYGRLAAGHLQAASFVSAGMVDACIAPRAAARAFGLGFVPLATERYDLFIPRHEMITPAVQALLEALQAAPVRGALTGLAGYDTSRSGSEVRR